MVPDSSKVGVLITTVADGEGIKTTQTELAALGDSAVASSAKSVSAFDSFNKSLGTLGTQMTAVGRTMSTNVTLPIVAVGGASLKMAMDFNQSMTYVRTDAGDTTDNINQLSNSVLNLAKTSQFSPDVLANGLYHLASLGLRGADAMNALNTAQQMAAVGGADLESTATALGGALVSGIKGVQDYTSAAGVLDATIGAGNMRMQDLVGAIGTGVLPVFKNAGLSIVDFGAALATLTDNGQDASAAATHLRMTISLMEAPSQAAQKALAKIGMTSTQMGLDMQSKGLIPALQNLKTHLLDTYGTTDLGKTKMAAALTEMFGGGKSSAAIQTLLDQLDRVQNKETQIGQQSSEFNTKYAEQQQTAAAKFKTAWSSVQSDLIVLGDQLLPVAAKGLSDVSKAIDDVTGWYGRLSNGQQTFVKDSALVLAVIGPVLMVFGTMAKSISEIATLGGTIWSGISKIPDGIGSMFDMFGKIGSGTGSAAKSFGGMVSDWASSISNMSKKAASGAADITKSAGSAVAGWATSGATMVSDFAKSAASMAKNSITTAASMVKDGATAAGAWIKSAHDSEIGLGGTLIKMTKDSAVAAGNFVKDAAITSAAWVKGFVTASASAVKESAISSAAWVKNAAVSSYAWVTSELPRIIKSFVLTSTSATKEAIVSSAVWVKEAGVAAGAWVVQLARVIASTVAVAATTVAQGVVIAAVWVAQAVKVGVYAVAIDAAKTSTYLLGGVTVATGATMAAVFAGLVVDIYLIYDAVNKVIGAFDALRAANASAKSEAASTAAVNASMADMARNGTPEQKARASNYLSTGSAKGTTFASGTSYAPGGRTMVGEDGPEIIDMPTGSRVYPARQSASMSSSSTTHNTFTGNIYLQSQGAVTQWFKELNNDSLLASKGLTVRQGA